METPLIKDAMGRGRSVAAYNARLDFDISKGVLANLS
nr:MAG TPA: hypothetical protein [Caudoviricetes sp.]